MPNNDPKPPTDSVFDWPVRIYYEDTDAGGVVYHANYLHYMERARTEYLRDLGIEQDTLSRDHGIIFAVRSVEVRYLVPARFNDLLRVSVSLPVGRGASVSFYQTVCRGDDTLVTARVRVVSLDPVSLRPRRIPAFLLTALSLTESSIGQ